MIRGAIAIAMVAMLAGVWLIWARGAEQERVLLSARVVQAGATAAAVALGGIFAWRRGIIFRDEQPHITIEHEITHRQASPGYIHLEIATTLNNSSRVKVEFRNGLFSVEQIAPASDELVERLFANAFLESRAYKSLGWPLLKDTPLEWEKDERVVEPGEKAVETLEYIVPSGVESVLISTHFYNTRVMGVIPAGTNPRQAERKRILLFWRAVGVSGWTKTTAFDTLQVSSRG